MKTADKILDNIIEIHREYWLASTKYELELEEMERLNNKSDETLQRLRCMRTKLIADRYQIEFELNRIVEDVRR